MTIKKVILTAILLGSAQMAFAASVSTATGTVTKLQLGSTGHLFLTTTAAKINPASCPNSTYFLASDFASFNRYYALLMTAKASGNPVVLRINSATCSQGYPLLEGIEDRI